MNTHADFDVRIEFDGPLGRVALTDFRVSKMEPDELRLNPKRGQSIDLIDGQLVRTRKMKGGAVSREQLTERWSDWVDYWSVDFNHADIMRSEWQDYRDKRKRSLMLVTPWHSIGDRIAVQVVDIFANHFRHVYDVQ